MISTRRQFVTSTLAGLPVLIYPPEVEAQSRPQADDPVLSQIEGDLVRTYNELRENPKRIDSLRAFESALRFHAAYATAVHLDDSFKKALGRRIKARGRAPFLDEVLGDTHGEHRREAEIRKRFPGFTFDSRFSTSQAIAWDAADRWTTELQRRGINPVLRALADRVNAVSDKLAAAQPQGNMRPVTQSSECETLQTIVQALEVATGFVCALTMVQPELTPFCAVLAMELAGAQILAWLACMWF